MSLNSTPVSERVHIGFFGRRNAGKSSVVNAVTNQQISVVQTDCSEKNCLFPDQSYYCGKIIPRHY